MLEKGDPIRPTSFYEPPSPAPSDDLSRSLGPARPVSAPQVQVITPQPPNDILDLQKGICRYKGVYVELDPAQLRAIKKILTAAIIEFFQDEVADEEETP